MYDALPAQECERMNLLVGEIVRTLTDLCLAFKVTENAHSHKTKPRPNEAVDIVSSKI